ncbi:MAG: hypothetical protein J6C92_08955 [Bacteroidaceae bacterium]|nr:hypothetical protein [Bacteroidaceae bacterium]
MAVQTRIVDVYRKPSKCPVCGESVVDIIYGTGDMTEIEFFLEYRRPGIMGGDNIPRRPPVWACSCGCKRFRKINPDGSDADVKVKMLRNVKPAPASVITWETSLVERVLKTGIGVINHYQVEVTTELCESEKLNITAVNGEDAEDCAIGLVEKGALGLKGRKCVSVTVFDVAD